MSGKCKKKKWIKKRHVIVTRIVSLFLKPYVRIRYGMKLEKFKEQKDTPYLILLNHQTPFDQFFVGMCFKGAIYYVATEDIFSNGFVSSLIKFLVAPIPIKKQTTDVSAILNCIRIAKEGGAIAVAPEGNRTYSGRTEYMSPSIVPLARKLKMPIALYRIEGGYGAEPRWSDVVRKGKMRGYVSKVIEPEQYGAMTDDELFKAISDGLYVNEAVADSEFHHSRLAEYLERAIYVCPDCGLSTFESNKKIIECKKCHKKIEYLPTKELRGVGFDFPYRFVAEWYDHQEDYINSLDVTTLVDAPLYCDDARVSEVIVNKKKELMYKSAEIRLWGNRVEIYNEGKLLHKFNFDSTSAVTVLGKNKLNIYFEGKIYQLKGGKRFNALKYVHFYHRFDNIVKGEVDGKFLGL